MTRRELVPGIIRTAFSCYGHINVQSLRAADDRRHDVFLVGEQQWIIRRTRATDHLELFCCHKVLDYVRTKPFDLRIALPDESLLQL